MSLNSQCLAGVIVGRFMVSLQKALDEGWSYGGVMRHFWAGITTNHNAYSVSFVAGKLNVVIAWERTSVLSSGEIK
jgi:hypothetical protein